MNNINTAKKIIKKLIFKERERERERERKNVPPEISFDKIGLFSPENSSRSQIIFNLVWTAFSRHYNEKYNYLPEIEELNQEITKVEDNIAFLWEIIFRSEKIQAILFSQLENRTQQIALNTSNLDPQVEDKGLGSALRKLDLITKNLLVLVELNSNHIYWLLTTAVAWEEEKIADYKKQIERFISQWQKQDKNEEEPEIYEDEGELNLGSSQLNLNPLQDLLTGYYKRFQDQEQLINVLKAQAEDRGKILERMEKFGQEQEEKISILENQVREERGAKKNQEQELDNLKGTYWEAYKVISNENESLKTQLATKEERLDKATAEIAELQENLWDIQNAPSASSNDWTTDPNQITQKFLDLHEEELTKKWSEREEYWGGEIARLTERHNQEWAAWADNCQTLEEERNEACELLRASQDEVENCRNEAENNEIAREKIVEGMSEEIQRLEGRIWSLKRGNALLKISFFLHRESIRQKERQGKILQTRLTELERANGDLQKLLILVGFSILLISILLIVILLREKKTNKAKFKNFLYNEQK